MILHDSSKFHRVQLVVHHSCVAAFISWIVNVAVRFFLKIAYTVVSAFNVIDSWAVIAQLLVFHHTNVYQSFDAEYVLVEREITVH